MAPLTWVLVALVAAVVVLGIGMISASSGAGQFFADLRSWLRREPGATGLHPLADLRRELSDADEDAESVDALFEIGEQPRDAYVDPVAVVRPLSRIPRPHRGGAGSSGPGRPGRRRPPAPDRLLR